MTTIKHYPILEQGSERWLEVRRNHGLTASRLGTALGTGYISRNAYMRLKLGDEDPVEINPNMQFGMDNEARVACMYQTFMRNNQESIQLTNDGFIELADDPRSGCSVDRLVHNERGEKWVLEIKCRPRGDMRNEVPVSHVLQCVMNAVAYECDYAHYVCYAPEDDKTNLYIARIDFNKKKLWDHFLIHKIREFNSKWEKKIYYPPRMRTGEAKTNESVVRAYTRITPITKTRPIL